METTILNVTLKTRIDRDAPVDCPLEWSEPRPPIMVHTNIIHKEYTIRFPSNNDEENSWQSVERSECFWSEIGMFIVGDEDARIDNLSPHLSSQGIALPYHAGLVNEISQLFYRLAQTFEPLEECILNVTLEVATLMRELEGSIDEYERRTNYGMVPTATESLATVEKRVKVEEKSDCSICLDGLEDYASAMPCKHMFHEDCILTWLNHSHYCPICRFQLPAMNSLSLHD